MRRLVDTLSEVDTRLLVLAAILFCAVVFALIKASGAINGTVSQPAYQNTPAQGFVPPASVTLVSPTYLTAPRLPDVDFIAVVGSARSLADSVADLTVTSAQLQHAGLSAQSAQSTILDLHADDATLSGRQFDVAQNLPLMPGTNDTSAVVTASVQYSGSGDQSPVSATENFSYALSPSNQWLLQSVSLIINSSTGGINN
jgi:hypothetical protein